MFTQARDNIPQVEDTIAKLGVVLNDTSFRYQLPVAVEQDGLKTKMNLINSMDISQSNITLGGAMLKLNANLNNVNKDYSIQVP